MNRLCTICARRGSKGVPGKNVRPVAGLPLIAHSIRQALATDLFEAVVVSSDDPDILAVAEAHGAQTIRRPDVLASDTAGKLPAIRHCVTTFEERVGRRFDILTDLDATSPLRDPEDIAACVALVEREGAQNVITAAPARRSPYFNLVELDDEGCPVLSKTVAGSVARRQDSPDCFDMNASIYVWRRESLMDRDTLFGPGARLHVMPEERSIDIDSPLDLRIVEMLLTERGGA